MTPDSYLASVLNKYAVPRDHVRQVELVAADLYPAQEEGAPLLGRPLL